MATNAIRVTADTKALTAVLSDLVEQIERMSALPKVAQRLAELLLRLLLRLPKKLLFRVDAAPAAATGELAYRLRAGRLLKLFAAAMRAANRSVCHE